MVHMIQKLVALPVGLILLLVPVAASASTLDDIHSRIMYTLGQIAALKAQSSGDPVTCALVSSKASISVGESFALIWNTFGATEPSNDSGVSQWARGGISTIRVDAPGTYQYKLTFNGVSGGQASCAVKVAVHA